MQIHFGLLDTVDDFSDVFREELPSHLKARSAYTFEINLKQDHPPHARSAIRLSFEELGTLRKVLASSSAKGFFAPPHRAMGLRFLS